MTYNEFIKILEENTAEHLCVYMHCNTKNGIISISPADILELLNEKRIENQKQKPKTNYDRIKSMSVEEMAGLIVDFQFVFQCKSYGLNPKTVYENMDEEDKKKNKEWEEEMRPIWERWLLKEVNENE